MKIKHKIITILCVVVVIFSSFILPISASYQNDETDYKHITPQWMMDTVSNNGETMTINLVPILNDTITSTITEIVQSGNVSQEIIYSNIVSRSNYSDVTYDLTFDNGLDNQVCRIYASDFYIEYKNGFTFYSPSLNVPSGYTAIVDTYITYYKSNDPSQTLKNIRFATYDTVGIVEFLPYDKISVMFDDDNEYVRIFEYEMDIKFIKTSTLEVSKYLTSFNPLKNIVPLVDRGSIADGETVVGYIGDTFEVDVQQYSDCGWYGEVGTWNDSDGFLEVIFSNHGIGLFFVYDSADEIIATINCVCLLDGAMENVVLPYSSFIFDEVLTTVNVANIWPPDQTKALAPYYCIDVVEVVLPYTDVDGMMLHIEKVSIPIVAPNGPNEPIDHVVLYGYLEQNGNVVEDYDWYILGNKSSLESFSGVPFQIENVNTNQVVYDWFITNTTNYNDVSVLPTPTLHYNQFSGNFTFSNLGDAETIYFVSGGEIVYTSDAIVTDVNISLLNLDYGIHDVYIYTTANGYSQSFTSNIVQVTIEEVVDTSFTVSFKYYLTTVTNYNSTIYNYDNVLKHSYAESINDIDFDLTSWIATAVGGFLDAEIFPGFSFGGILGVMLAICVVVVFLKIFAGG